MSGSQKQWPGSSTGLESTKSSIKPAPLFVYIGRIENESPDSEPGHSPELSGNQKQSLGLVKLLSWRK